MQWLADNVFVDGHKDTSHKGKENVTCGVLELVRRVNDRLEAMQQNTPNASRPILFGKSSLKKIEEFYSVSSEKYSKKELEKQKKDLQQQSRLEKLGAPIASGASANPFNKVNPFAPKPIVANNPKVDAFADVPKSDADKNADKNEKRFKRLKPDYERLKK